MASPIAVEEITEVPSAVARVLPGGPPSRFVVRVNRALAQALEVRHRVRHSVDVRAKIPPKPPGAVLSEEEKLLRAIFGEKHDDDIPPEGEVVAVGERVKKWQRLIHHVEGDVSFSDAEWGEVESVTRETDALPKGIGERIVVVVTWRGPLEAGDLLYAGDTALGVVEAIEDDGASEPRVTSGAGGGTRTVSRRLPTAMQSVEARSIGPYSIVTQRPITGQRIRPGQLAWLAENGARALAGEFATYKTGDVTSRVRVYETMVKGEPVKDPWSELRPPPQPPLPPPPRPPAPAGSGGGMKDIFSFFERPKDKALTTEPLRLLDAQLRACGLGITLDGHDLRLELRLPDVDRDTWSHGEVKKPETINYRTYKPEPGGLFCEKTFGPVKDYECACGKYKRMKHRGIICEKCGVEVIRSSVRRERFAHLALPACVVPKHLRRLVSVLLGESSKSWIAGMDQDGGVSVRERLAAVDVAWRARNTAPGERALVESFAATGIAPASLAWNAVPVLPPDLRPLVPLPGGRFATSDLNDLYRRVINRSNRLRRLMELNAPLEILINERRMMREAVDQLLFNGAKGIPVVTFGKRPLVSVFKLLKGTLRPDRAGIRTDYSAAATALVEDSRTHVAVPFAVLSEILRPLYARLESRGLVTTIKGAKSLLEEDVETRRRFVTELTNEGLVLLFGNSLMGDAMTAAGVEIGDDPVIRMPASVASRIGVRTGSRVAAHLPLSVPGIEEARGLARGERRATPVRREGWIADVGAMKRGTADRLVELALARAEDPCESPYAAFLVGGWVLAQ